MSNVEGQMVYVIVMYLWYFPITMLRVCRYASMETTRKKHCPLHRFQFPDDQIILNLILVHLLLQKDTNKFHGLRKHPSYQVRVQAATKEPKFQLKWRLPRYGIHAETFCEKAKSTSRFLPLLKMLNDNPGWILMNTKRHKETWFVYVWAPLLGPCKRIQGWH